MPSDSTVAATATATTSEHHVPRPLLRTGHRSFSVKASMLPPTPPNASLRHTTSRSHRKRAHSLGTTTSTLVRSASASGPLYKLEHYHVAMESNKSSSSPATTSSMPPHGKSRVTPSTTTTPSKPSAPCSWSQEQLRALDVDRIGDVWQPMQIRRSLRRSVLQRNAVRVLASQVAAMNSGTRPRPSSTSSSASSSGGAGAGAGAGADTEQAPGAGTSLRRTYSVESTGSSLSITSTASTSVESVCSVASDAHVSVIDSVDVLVANTNTNTTTSTSSPRSTHA